MIAVAAILLVWLYFLLSPKKRWRVRRSIKLLKKLRSIESPQQVFGYLRKIDPFLFEELLLTCLEERGLVVKRNERYTGDGGTDGQVYLAGRMMHIQAKRYSSHIKLEHVREFLQLIERDRTKGIFIHTGRTGKGARGVLSTELLDCVSGSRLIALIMGDPVNLHGVRLNAVG
ncbi:MAG: restriction endonuclease [Gammaproteobacteria bacterium]|nr:restriction endonuclease [Gammaproteobacteria bacterium]